MEICNFKDLTVWQQAVVLAEEIYTVTQLFPKEETYSLKAQMRRAAVSIASAITEGNIRRSKPEFARFVNISCGSLAELETQIILAERLDYISDEQLKILDNTIDQIRKMLFSLYSSLTKQAA